MPVFSDEKLSSLQKVISEAFLSHLRKNEADLKKKDTWGDVVFNALEQATQELEQFKDLDDSAVEYISAECILDAGRQLEEGEADINTLSTVFDKGLQERLEFLKDNDELTNESYSSPRP